METTIQGAGVGPSREALEAAASVARRVSDRSAQVRRLFVVSTDPTQAPPLTTMLRGGRGGGVRLKLYLSLLWFAANPPYDVTYPARAWAQLLDLPDPETSGARRISDALAWLAQRNYIEVQLRPGQASRVLLREESGLDRDYAVPGAKWRTMGPDDSDAERQRQRYIRLPPDLWTSGWLQVLDGSAIAMLLILLAESPAESTGRERIWFSPSEAAKRYNLSPATRTKGLSQLTRVGLVVTERVVIRNDAFEVRRNRNAYRLKLDRLRDKAFIDTIQMTDQMTDQQV